MYHLKKGLSWVVVVFLLVTSVFSTYALDERVNYKISGYIVPDFVFSETAAPIVKANFKVEIVEMGVSAFTDIQGYFEFTGIPENVAGYTLKISKDYYLTRMISNLSVTSDLKVSNEGAPLDMWAGDVLIQGVQDDAINMTDMMAVNAVFNTGVADPEYVEGLDFNKDQAINMTDIMIIVKHFNTSISSYPQWILPFKYEEPVAYDLNLVQGDILDLAIKNYDITETAMYSVELSYNPNELEPIDLCSQTFHKERVLGRVPQARLKIDRYMPEEGLVQFSRRITVPDAKKLSFTINAVKFKSKITGNSQITYKVRKVTGGEFIASTAGLNHTLALKSDGTVWGWGQNIYGQLGDGTRVNRYTPIQIPQMTDIVDIDTRWNHSVALKDDGTVWTWGSNWAGQLGYANAGTQDTPEQVPGVDGIIAVAAGAAHTMALRYDGTVWAWGENSEGQLGDGKYAQRWTPQKVKDLKGVIAIAGGYNHSLALNSDKTVFAWGQNAKGQLGNGTYTRSTVPVPVQNLSDVASIACGGDHSMAISGNGNLSTWGYNGKGQLGNSSITDSNVPVVLNGIQDVIGIKGGGTHTVAVKKDESVWCWGSNFYGQLGNGTRQDKNEPFRVYYLEGITNIACGDGHSMAIKRDGTVWTWGNNERGQIGNGTIAIEPGHVSATGIVDAQKVACGRNQTLVLKSDKTVVGWGSNVSGELGDGTTYDRLSPVSLSLNNVADIQAGHRFSMALKEDQTVWAWGSNDFGQLGDATYTDRTSPVMVNGLTNVTSISSGTNHGMALASDKRVYTWGANYYEQLGYTTAENKNGQAQSVAGLDNVQKIAAGGHHSMALKENGTVWAWGWNSAGQLGDGTFENKVNPVQVQDVNSQALSGITEIDAGWGHSLALKNDGTVWAWGSNTQGQLGINQWSNVHRARKVKLADGSDLTHVVAIFAGYDFSFALKNDGSLWAWGYNASAQLGDGTTSGRNYAVPASSAINIADMDGGESHAAVVTGQGTVITWGSNAFGQMGNGERGIVAVPQSVDFGTRSTGADPLQTPSVSEGFELVTKVIWLSVNRDDEMPGTMQMPFEIQAIEKISQ